MHEQLTEQFKSIRQTLSINVETIGMLIKQANSLSKIAEGLNGAGAVSDDTKKQLGQEVEKINSSIVTLIQQTDKLFQLYDQVADAIYHQKQ